MPKKPTSNTHKWKYAARGVRYFEHATRKHGMRKDKYFAIAFTVDYKRTEIGLGWQSDGWTLDRAMAMRAELRENARMGKGPRTLKEIRAANEAAMAAEKEAEKLAMRSNITLAAFFKDEYAPNVLDQKKLSSRAREVSLFENHIKPCLGKVRVRELVAFHLEKLRKSMLDKGLTERSADYGWQTLSSIIGYAQEEGIYTGPNPVSLQRRKDRGRRRIQDNSRHRFLSEEEAARLLEALRERSQDVHDQTMLSLRAGLRFGEIATLAWSDIDFEHGMLTLRSTNTKSGRTRHLPLTDDVVAMLKSRPRRNILVFPGQSGGVQAQVSDTFNRVVEELGFNANIHDVSQKVVFHTCRHTFASWLVMRGVPLHTVQTLLGHSSIAMTMRYSHLAPDHLRAAVSSLDTPLDTPALRVVR